MISKLTFFNIMQKILRNIEEGIHVIDNDGITIIYNNEMSVSVFTDDDGYTEIDDEDDMEMFILKGMPECITGEELIEFDEAVTPITITIKNTIGSDKVMVYANIIHDSMYHDVTEEATDYKSWTGTKAWIHSITDEEITIKADSDEALYGMLLEYIALPPKYIINNEPTFIDNNNENEIEHELGQLDHITILTPYASGVISYPKLEKGTNVDKVTNASGYLCTVVRLIEQDEPTKELYEHFINAE